MKTRVLSSCAVLALALASLPAHAQSAGGGGFSLGGLLLLAVVAGIAWLLLRRRPEPPPPPLNPYARDDAFGRDPYAAPMPPPQEGMGSSVARGVATGLAVGAGAVLAQELGRRAFEHGPEGAPPPAHDAPRGDLGADHAANTHSPLARDAGLGALQGPGAQGFVDDPDVFPVADAGGWDDAGFDDAGGDWDR